MNADRARRVFAVAEQAVNSLRSERPMGDDWVIAWTASVALLRTVGHALKYVDAKAGPELAQAIDDAWKRWKAAPEQHAVFWRFIEATRNAILKQFELGAGQGVRVAPGVGHSVLYHVYIEGFEDLDQIQLLDRALDWWRSELAAIEAAASAAGG